MTEQPTEQPTDSTTPGPVAPVAQAGTGPGPDAVTLRPRVIRWTAWISALGVMVFFLIATYYMPAEDTGVIFQPADQVAMMVIGAFVAGGLLLMARPRVRADAHGVEVRNVFVARWYDWADVYGVSFPDGAASARLELADDEYQGVLAVQAVDRGLAVRHVRTLRTLHRTAVLGS